MSFSYWGRGHSKKGQTQMENQSYIGIAEAVDRGIQGAPKSGGELSKAFIAYLKLVYTPEEAEICRHLNMPNKFKTSAQVAEDAGRDIAVKSRQRRLIWEPAC